VEQRPFQVAQTAPNFAATQIFHEFFQLIRVGWRAFCNARTPPFVCHRQLMRKKAASGGARMRAREFANSRGILKYSAGDKSPCALFAPVRSSDRPPVHGLLGRKNKQCYTQRSLNLNVHINAIGKMERVLRGRRMDL
jgi:hypothetical protein